MAAEAETAGTAASWFTTEEVTLVTSLQINGTEIIGYIYMDGFDWRREDVDGANAGRTVTAKAIRDVLGSKIRMDMECRELTSAERTTLENLLFADEFLTVSCDDAIFRGAVSRKMYCNSMSGRFSRRKANGTEYWKNVKFVLVEQ